MRTLSILRCAFAASVLIGAFATSSTAQFPPGITVSALPASGGSSNIGTYDFVTKTVIPPEPDPEGGLEPQVVFDQSKLVKADAPDDKLPETVPYWLQLNPGVVGVDWGDLSIVGVNAIHSIDIAYATTSTEPVDIAIYLLVDTSLGDSGEGTRILLENLPGASSPSFVEIGINIVNVSLVDALGAPLVLPDPDPDQPTKIGYAYEVLSPSTGPGIVEREEAGVTKNMDAYDLAGFLIPSNPELGSLKIAQGSVPDGGNVDEAVYMVMYGTAAPTYSEAGKTDVVLSRGDRFNGVLDRVGDEDVLRYSSLAGEDLAATLSAVGKNTSLKPHLAVCDAEGNLVVEAGTGAEGETSVSVTAELEAGLYLIKVSGLEDTTGSYRLRATTKVPKETRNPPVAETAQLEGGVMTSFVAEAGAHLSARVSTVEVVGTFDVTAPVLMGPLGPVDIADYTTLKGSTFRIKNAPLGAFGGYQLVAGDPGGGLGQVINKIRVNPPKDRRSKINELRSTLTGSWLRDGLNAAFATQRLLLVDRKGSRYVNQLGPASDNVTATHKVSGLKVLVEEDGSRLISYKLGAPKLTGGSELTGNKAGSQLISAMYNHPVDDPNIIVLDNGETWRRDFTQGPGIPVVTGAITNDPAGSGLQAGHAALVIECVPGAVEYQILKADVDGAPPVFVTEVHMAVCKGEEDDQMTTWVDLASLAGGVLQPATYYVRAVDDNGSAGGLSAPVTVTGAP